MQAVRRPITEPETAEVAELRALLQLQAQVNADAEARIAEKERLRADAEAARADAAAARADAEARAEAAQARIAALDEAALAQPPRADAELGAAAGRAPSARCCVIS